MLQLSWIFELNKSRGKRVNIEQKLYQAAKEFIEKRYPTGWGGAAAMYTNTGEILTSVSPVYLTYLFYQNKYG
jgi:hypothetical protein